MTKSLAERLAELGAKDISELRVLWGKRTGRAAPQLSAALLRLALAHQIQVSTFGGVSRTTQQRLAQLAAAKTVTRQVAPGMRLVREWNGTAQIVTIGANGEIEWNGKTWRSLSEVARAITGTRWSGPAFFGLKQPRKAA